MLAAEGVWNGGQPHIIELDVPSHETFPLPDTMLELPSYPDTWGQMPLEAVIMASAYKVKFAFGPQDGFGDDLLPGTRGSDLGSEALQYLRRQSTRSQRFKDAQGNLSFPILAKNQLRKRWWHREGALLRTGFTIGEIKARLRPDLIRGRHELLRCKVWYDYGESPPETLTT